MCGGANRGIGLGDSLNFDLISVSHGKRYQIIGFENFSRSPRVCVCVQWTHKNRCRFYCGSTKSIRYDPLESDSVRMARAIIVRHIHRNTCARTNVARKKVPNFMPSFLSVRTLSASTEYHTVCVCAGIKADKTARIVFGVIFSHYRLFVRLPKTRQTKNGSFCVCARLTYSGICVCLARCSATLRATVSHALNVCVCTFFGFKEQKINENSPLANEAKSVYLSATNFFGGAARVRLRPNDKDFYYTQTRA